MEKSNNAKSYLKNFYVGSTCHEQDEYLALAHRGPGVKKYNRTNKKCLNIHLDRFPTCHNASRTSARG